MTVDYIASVHGTKAPFTIPTFVGFFLYVDRIFCVVCCFWSLALFSHTIMLTQLLHHRELQVQAECGLSSVWNTASVLSCRLRRASSKTDLPGASPQGRLVTNRSWYEIHSFHAQLRYWSFVSCLGKTNDCVHRTHFVQSCSVCSRDHMHVDKPTASARSLEIRQLLRLVIYQTF